MTNPEQMFFPFGDPSATYLQVAETERAHLHDMLCDAVAERFPIVHRDVDKIPKEEFSKIRNKAFGASDSSVLLGVAYHTDKVAMKTTDVLISEKIAEIHDEEIEKKASVRKGSDLEAVFISKFEERLHATIIKPKHMFGSDFGMHTNFDGVIFENTRLTKDAAAYIRIPFEIKLCTQFGRKNYEWKAGVSEFDANKTMQPEVLLPLVVYPNVNIREHIEMNAARYGIPPYYYTQLQQQMLFLDAPHGYLGVMDDAEWTLYLFKVPRDQRTIAELTLAVTRAYTTLARSKKLPLPKVQDRVSII